jgi:hypothetical protein
VAAVVVSVAGATSRAGKTALAESCLAALPRGGAIAVKFTTSEDVFESCPRGTPCTVCDLDRPWRLVDDPAILGVPGTDTERLARAGARRVVWAIARRSAAREAWAEVAAGLDGLAVIEGSSVVALADPRLLLFVVHPRLDPGRWKAGSAELMRRADAVILNRPQRASGEPSAAVREAVFQARGSGDVREADVTQPLGEWAPDLFHRLAAIGRARLSAGAKAAGARPGRLAARGA